jgi:hypothetical protein
VVEPWVKTPPTSDNGAGCYGWLLEQKRQKLAKEKGSSRWLQWWFLSLDHDGAWGEELVYWWLSSAGVRGGGSGGEREREREREKMLEKKTGERTGFFVDFEHDFLILEDVKSIHIYSEWNKDILDLCNLTFNLLLNF